MIMYGLNYSRLTYGIVGWGAANKTQITKLNKVHSKVMKLQEKVRHFPKKQLNLNEKFAVEVLPYNYTSLVENYQGITLNTRNKLLSLPKNIKEVWKRSHRCHAIMYFNKLPPNVKSLKQDKRKYILEKHIRMLNFE
ncbi:hypothetical protein QAD02_000126 [Eretmocerus hayati]|uniref:Uncharacterized protein n=1 Tax=Eretmocerus hayati TaxID=131215 RepID=A0ACC2NCJ5_9HYME|nr:hypothetical protein QAD02_000126 [Eretmocerus hayati]